MREEMGIPVCTGGTRKYFLISLPEVNPGKPWDVKISRDYGNEEWEESVCSLRMLQNHRFCTLIVC